MKYVTKFMDGSSVMCSRCGGHPDGVYLFGANWVCEDCLLPEDMFLFGYRAHSNIDGSIRRCSIGEVDKRREHSG